MCVQEDAHREHGGGDLQPICAHDHGDCGCHSEFVVLGGSSESSSGHGVDLQAAAQAAAAAAAAITVPDVPVVGQQDAEDESVVQRLFAYVKSNRKPKRPRLPSYNVDGSARKPYSYNKRRALNYTKSDAGRAQRVLKAVAQLLACTACICAMVLGTNVASSIGEAHMRTLNMDVAHRGAWIEQEILKADRRGYRLVAGEKACNDCWLAFHGVGRTKFYKHQRAVRAGSTEVKADTRGQWQEGRHGSEWWEAHAWIKEFSEKYGDNMPDSFVVQVPCHSQKEFYQMYQLDHSDEMKIVTQSTFLQILKGYFPYLNVRKYKRFPTCNTCLELDRAIEEAVNPSDKATLVLQKRAHRRKVYEEKAVYYDNRRKARARPDKYMSIIIDGMDQAKTDVPQFVRDSKKTDSLPRMKTAITGVLVHGHAPYALAYVSPDRHPKDRNAVFNVLVDVLKRVQEATGKPPPDVLFLQLDNVSSENKNTTLLTMMGMLVQTGVFKEIHVSYLPVGHTHEDIDQMFSRFANALRQNSAPTMKDFLTVIEESFHPRPVTVESIPNMIDYHEWLTVNDCYYGRWHGVREYRCFRFSKDAEGYVILHNRLRMVGPSVDDAALVMSQPHLDWQPLHGQRILKRVPEGEARQTNVIVTRPLQYDMIMHTIHECAAMCVLSQEQVEEWERYLGAFQDEDRNVCAGCAVHRAEMMANSTSNRYSHEENLRRGRERRKAQRALCKHQREDVTCTQDVTYVPFPWQFPEEDAAAAVVGSHARAVHPEQPDEAFTGRVVVDHIDQEPVNTFTIRNQLNQEPSSDAAFAKAIGTYVAVFIDRGDRERPDSDFYLLKVKTMTASSYSGTWFGNDWTKNTRHPRVTCTEEFLLGPIWQGWGCEDKHTWSKRKPAHRDLRSEFNHEGDRKEILIYDVSYSNSTGHIAESDHDAIRRAIQRTLDALGLSSENA